MATDITAVRMTRTENGSNDGSTIHTFGKDKVYRVPVQISESLANTFVNEMKCAVSVSARKGAGEQPLTEEQVSEKKAAPAKSASSEDSS